MALSNISTSRPCMYKRYTDVRKLMDDARPAQQITEREAKNWKTLSQINEHRVELQQKVNRTIVPKRPDELTVGDKVTLIWYLVLCLYTMMSAIRNNWSDLRVVRFEDIDSTVTREVMSGSQNYLLEFARGSYSLYLNVYKTVKTHGPQKLDIPVRLANVIAKSL
jgi:hypothetical protein